MSIVSDVKEVADLIKKIGDVELYRKIVELQGEVTDLSTENYTLRQENQELKRSLKLGKEMTYKKPLYYIEPDPNPFCPKCWEVDKVAVHMITALRDQGKTHHYCPNCKTAVWL